MISLLQTVQSSTNLTANNNINSEIPQVGSREGRVYANLTPNLIEIERLFLEDTSNGKNEVKNCQYNKH